MSEKPTEEERQRAIECFNDSMKKGGHGHRFPRSRLVSLNDACVLCGIKATTWGTHIHPTLKS